jgi:hypothetical protein
VAQISSLSSQNLSEESLAPAPLSLPRRRNFSTGVAQTPSQNPQQPVEDGPSSETSLPHTRNPTIVLTPASCSNTDSRATINSSVSILDPVEFALPCEIELILGIEESPGHRPRRDVDETVLVIVHPAISYDQLVNRIRESMAGPARSLAPPIFLDRNMISEIYFKWPRHSHPSYTPSDRYQSMGAKTGKNIASIEVTTDNCHADLDLLQRRCGKDALVVGSTSHRGDPVITLRGK